MKLDNIVRTLFTGLVIAGTSLGLSDYTEAKRAVVKPEVQIRQEGIYPRTKLPSFETKRQVYCDQFGHFYFDNCKKDYFNEIRCSGDEIKLPNYNKCKIKVRNKQKTQKISSNGEKSEACKPNYVCPDWNNSLCKNEKQERVCNDTCSKKSRVETQNCQSKDIKKSEEKKDTYKTEISRFAGYGTFKLGFLTNKTEDGNGNEWKFEGRKYSGEVAGFVDIDKSNTLGILASYSREGFNNNSKGGDGSRNQVDVGGLYIQGNSKKNYGFGLFYSGDNSTFNYKGDKFKRSFNCGKFITKGNIELTNPKEKGFGVGTFWNGNFKIGSFDKTGGEKLDMITLNLSGGVEGLYIHPKTGTFALGAITEFNAQKEGYKDKLTTGFNINPRFRWNNHKGSSVEITGYVPVKTNGYKRLGINGLGVAKVTGGLGILGGLGYNCNEIKNKPFNESKCTLSVMLGLGTTGSDIPYTLMQNSEMY